MRSPFPGMDPYIEASHLWEDFHNKLIGEIERALSARVPDRYVVRTGERSYVALAQLDNEGEERAFLPDVAVTSSRGPAKAGRKSKGSARNTARDEPGAVTMRALVKADYREPYLEIRQVDPEHKLITGIEILSPSNKRPGQSHLIPSKNRHKVLQGARIPPCAEAFAAEAVRIPSVLLQDR
jgi:hypothetical protein